MLTFTNSIIYKTHLTVSTPIIKKKSFNIPFLSGLSVDKTQFALKDALKKIPNYSIEEYKQLSEQELNTIRSACDKILKLQLFDAEIHDIISDKMKNYMDKKYGENGYDVLVIGRSLSSIGKVLGYKIGEKRVKNLPLSDAKKYLIPNYINFEKNNGDFDILNKFLKTLGLTRKKIENSDKRLLIVDYCVSGKSLKGAFNLLTQKEILGKRNIKMLNIMDCIENAEDKEILEKKLYRGSYKDFAFVKRAYFLKDIPNSLIDTSTDSMEAKLFKFKMLDNYMKKIHEE